MPEDDESLFTIELATGTSIELRRDSDMGMFIIEFVGDLDPVPLLGWGDVAAVAEQFDLAAAFLRS